MSKYNQMIEHMHMPQEEYEKLKSELMNQAGSKRIVRSMWRRHVAAAALVLCLLGTAATAYAAVRYQWFSMFFDNGNEESGILKEYAAKASTKEVTAQNENYKFTVLSHLCSKEQKMGLIICSFHFLTENDTYMSVNDTRKDNVTILKKDGVMTGAEAEFTAREDRTVRDLAFCIGDGSHTGALSANVVYFSGETSEDGGYLVGIRYNFVERDVTEQNSPLILSLENAGDVEHKLRVCLPESEDIECVRFVSENRSGDYIDISSIGMALTITEEKAAHQENVFDHEILKDTKFVMKNSDETAGTGHGFETSILLEETDTKYTWLVQKEFLNLIDVSDIKYIELDGERYQAVIQPIPFSYAF